MASFLPMTDEDRELLINVYGNLTDVSHDPYISMDWSTAIASTTTS